MWTSEPTRRYIRQFHRKSFLVAVFVDARPELVVNGMQCAHNVIDVVFNSAASFMESPSRSRRRNYIRNPSKTICRRQIKRGRVSPRTSLKVVFTSCSGCFQSQNAWVKNADAPVSVDSVPNVLLGAKKGDKIQAFRLFRRGV